MLAKEIIEKVLLNTIGTKLTIPTSSVFTLIEFTELAKALETNNTLTELDLSGHDIGGAGAKALIPVIKKNTTLRCLNLSFCQLHAGEGFTALILALLDNKTLEEVCLNPNNMGVPEARALARVIRYNTTLRVLSFSCSPDKNQVELLTSALITNKTLDTLLLVLPPFQLWQKALSIIIRNNHYLRNIIQVNSGGPRNKIFDEATALNLGVALLGNKGLQNFNLQNSNIGSVGGAKVFSAVLRGNSTLQHLCLRNCDFDRKGVEDLIQALPYNNALVTLNFNHIMRYDHTTIDKPDFISPESTTILANFLRKTRTVQNLNLFRSGFNAAGVTTLISALQYNTTVRELSLNNLDLAGAQALAGVIGNNTLECLKLSYAGLNSAMIIALAPALEANSSLRSVNLRGNNIASSETTVALASIIRKNKTLQDLNLIFCGLDEASVSQFHDSLLINRTLLRLGLRDIVEMDAVGGGSNTHSKATADNITALLERNKKIRHRVNLNWANVSMWIAASRAVTGEAESKMLLGVPPLFHYIAQMAGIKPMQKAIPNNIFGQTRDRMKDSIQQPQLVLKELLEDDTRLDEESRLSYEALANKPLNEIENAFMLAILGTSTTQQNDSTFKLEVKSRGEDLVLLNSGLQSCTATATATPASLTSLVSRTCVSSNSNSNSLTPLFSNIIQHTMTQTAMPQQNNIDDILNSLYYKLIEVGFSKQHSVINTKGFLRKHVRKGIHTFRELETELEGLKPSNLFQHDFIVAIKKLAQNERNQTEKRASSTAIISSKK